MPSTTKVGMKHQLSTDTMRDDQRSNSAARVRVCCVQGVLNTPASLSATAMNSVTGKATMPASEPSPSR